jgi:hypothetical protein
MSSEEKKGLIDSVQSENLSMEKIIDLVRQVRNDLVKDFLIKDNSQNYFAEHYNKPLSTIKLEFLRRDLSELLISPVDLVHYSSLIKEIRETNSASLSKGNNDELFYKELELIFDKYKY